MAEKPAKEIEYVIGRAAAALFLIALVTGLYAGVAMSGKIPVDGSAALASHLNALMGTFLLVSFGWTLPMLRYSDKAKRTIAMLFIATSFANWLITAVKAALNVRGLDLVGKPANDTIFIALQIGVVIPSIVAAIAWVRGFRGPPPGAG